MRIRKRRLPIFIEFSIISLGIITCILVVYTIIQAISINFYIVDYQKDELEKRYEELKYTLATEEINEKALEIFTLDDDELIRIYSNDEIKYTSNNDKDDIFNKIYVGNNDDKKIKVKSIGFDRYIVLDAPIKINNEMMNIQIIKSEDIFEDFIEVYFPVGLVFLVIGIILSIIGAIYISRRFINRLNDISNNISEVKRKGIKYRVEISDRNDEFDKVNIMFNSMMDKLECTFDEQSRFVSDASHELRTPLTAIQGHLRMIKRWGKNDKERLEKSLDVCIYETERLIKIANELLVLSRMEKENLDIEEIHSINIKCIIINIIESYKVLNNNVEFKVKIDSNLEAKIKEEHLRQLLIIFIDNAIKYNDKDICSIRICANKINNEVIFSIRDNGIGIPEEEIKNVVNRFYKVDKSRVNNNSFGIGLSIADKILKKYNTKITILSKEKEYTEIIFKLSN